MTMLRIIILSTIIIVSCFTPMSQSGKKQGSKPEKVTICQLKNDPAAYNHKLIEVTGFVTHGFEDFTLFDPNCSSRPDIWLEYGGVVASGTIYCCGVTAERSRPKQIVIEDIPISLVDDAQFREFDKLIQRRPDTVVRAAIIGRFFSGEQVEYPTGVFWGGYGYMGCCSLLVIQQVIAVEPQDRNDLDYGASADQPNIDKVGCGYRDLISIQPYSELIEAQKSAELSQCERAFSDPQRVASETLARILNIDEKSITGIREERKVQGRIVYRWSLKAKRESYMIVVSRPYWLSFYSNDPKRVAWVVIAAYESSCGKGNSVARIR